jgi:hypothetical protein
MAWADDRLVTEDGAVLHLRSVCLPSLFFPLFVIFFLMGSDRRPFPTDFHLYISPCVRWHDFAMKLPVTALPSFSDIPVYHPLMSTLTPPLPD